MVRFRWTVTWGERRVPVVISDQGVILSAGEPLERWEGRSHARLARFARQLGLRLVFEGPDTTSVARQRVRE